MAQSSYADAPPVALGVRVAEPAPQARSLTTRYLDFWLLGGASILVWLAMFVSQHFRYEWAVDQHFKNLTITTISLTLFINNPHFLVSYKLAYGRGRAFVTAYWWQLIVVPLLLVALFAFAYMNFARPTADVLPFLPGTARTIGTWGGGTNLLTTPRFGDFAFTLAFAAMFFTVGWHYTKQAFGCMMLYASFDGYTLTVPQRQLLKWNLLGIWWVNFTYGNRQEAKLTFSDFSYYSLDLPDFFAPLAAWILAGGFALVLYQVFYRNYKDHGQRPSLTFLVPFVAMYVWWMPFTRQQEFYMLLTPFFHSLQYLAVVYKLEGSRLRGSSHAELKGTLLMLAIVAAGWLSFELLPHAADTVLQTFNTWRMFFFFTAAMLFINIHHYFIDNVVWRFKDPVIRKYLLA